MGGLVRRRRQAADTPLRVDLAKQLERYSVRGGIHCAGCGTWLADDESEVERWGYFGVGQVGKAYPYCAGCTQLRLVRR